MLLKTFQQLHYFPAIADVPPEITAHLASALGVKPEVVPEYRTPRTLYRHHEAIREYLGIQPASGKVATKIAERAAQVAAQVVFCMWSLARCRPNQTDSHSGPVHEFQIAAHA